MPRTSGTHATRRYAPCGAVGLLMDRPLGDPALAALQAMLNDPARLEERDARWQKISEWENELNLPFS